MATWKKGDKALCINNGDITPNDGKNPPLRLNVEYIVQDVCTCSCGCLVLDVGLGGTSMRTMCSCGNKYPDPEVHWADANRFVKRRPESEVREAIEKALDEENYELATELQKEL